MRKNNLKLAFTLVELMVFFIFISLLLAASTPIITKRVKNLPLKIHHGKFVCYGDSYEYYNASRLVSSGSGCKFTPPKRATLFKIELVGGGAGGYEYSDWKEYDETKSGSYKLDSGAEGEGYTDIDDDELLEMLYGAPFIYAVEGTDGGRGENSEDRTYTGVKSPHMVMNGECKGTCWSPTPYDCEKTGTRKKKDANGNYVKDENGNYVEEEYTYTGTCYTTQEEDGMSAYPTCSHCSSLQSTLRGIGNAVSSNANCNNEDWCYNIATTAFVAPYRTQALGIDQSGNSWGTIEDFSSERKTHGVGARGGYGQDFYISGTIDFCDYSNKESSACAKDSNGYKKVVGGTLLYSSGQKMDNGQICQNAQCSQSVSGIGIKPYLKNLFGTYLVKGTSNAKGSCAGWGTKKVKSHPETKIGNSRSSYIHGQDGDDIEHYDAMKLWGDRCYTNQERAKGGEGGWLQDTGSTIYGTNGTNLGRTLRKPYDASDYGITGSKFGPWTPKPGAARDRIPWLETSTTLNVRWHEVGAGGGAASYRVAYVSSLDKDCVFHVAGGGPSIKKGMLDAQLDAIHEGLTTTLTCNEGTLYLSADGGNYDTSTSISTYPGFDYITSQGQFTNPPTFVTSVSGGASPFNPKDVFTKYIIGKYSFGAGGRGTEITDTCTKPYGSWSVDRVYYDGIDKSDKQSWPKEPCGGVSTSAAESGSPGVIIISW